MLKLPDITLVAVSSGRVAETTKAMQHCMKHCEFGGVVFFSDRQTELPTVIVPTFKDIGEVSDFYAHGLMTEYEYSTSHILIVHWDGFILNPSAWTDDFLQYDYIGCYCPHWPGLQSGGFSLRSRKLLASCRKLLADTSNQEEDGLISLHRRDQFIAMGNKFAEDEVCRKFSIESNTYEGSFGFHSFSTKNIGDAKAIVGLTEADDCTGSWQKHKWTPLTK